MSTSEMNSFARRLRALEKAQVRGKTPSLAQSSIEDGALTAVDEDANQTMIIGKQFDGTNTAASVTGPTPPTPTPALTAPSPGGIRVYWDGTFEGGVPAPMDWARVTVHIVPQASYDPGTFTPLDQTQIYGSFETARGGEISPSLDSGDYIVVLVAWSQSGKFSAPSTPALGSPEDIVVDPSDGLPPSTSPTPVVYSGLGTLQVRWNAVENADPVQYRIFISTLDQYPPSPDSLIDTTSDTMKSISVDPDGNRLAYGQPYFVSIQAVDADGAAAPSPNVSGMAMQATNADISSDYGYLGTLVANQIIGGEITSPIVLSSEVKTADSGARSEMTGNGFAVYQAGEELVFNAPVEGKLLYRGDAEIDDLTLIGGATLRGSTEVSRSSYIVLADKVSPSRAAPGLSNTWDNHPTKLVLPDSSQGDPSLADLPEEWYDTPGWVLKGVVIDDSYTLFSWWGQYTTAGGTVHNLIFVGRSIDGTFSDPGNPTGSDFEGSLWDDELLAFTFSGDSPVGAPNEDGYYVVTRYNERTYLEWAPLGTWSLSGPSPTTPSIREECRLPNVGNFKWAATNVKINNVMYARIYGGVRNADGTVAMNRWDPNDASVSLVSINDPGLETDWDSKWGRVGGAAGVGSLVEDGDYIKLTSSASSGNAGYTIGEKIDLPVSPGERITAAHMIWPATSSLFGKSVRIQLVWWNASDAVVSSSEEVFTFPNSAAWLTIQAEGTAPAGATRVSMRVFFAATATGQVVYGGTTGIAKAGGLDAPVETLTLNTGSPITELLGITVAKGDFSDYRILVLERTGSVATARAFTLAGARVSADDFPLPTTGVASVYWNDDALWWETVDTNGTVYKHENGTKSFDKLHVSFTWKKGTQYESAQSSIATINNKRRSKLVINIPPKVITGQPDDPDSAGIYLGQGASVPSRTGMYLQSTITGTSLTVKNPTFAAVNPPDPANNPKDFPSAIPGRVYSSVSDAEGPLLDLKGDATARAGNFRVDNGVANIGRMQTWLTTTGNGAANGVFEAHTGGWSIITGDHTANDGWTGVIYSGNGIWTCQKTGRYQIELGYNWQANTGGRRILFIYKNEASPGTGNGYRRFTVQVPSVSSSLLQIASAKMYLTAGDTFRFGVYQSGSTGSVALSASTTEGPIYNGVSYSQFMEVTRIG